VVGEAGRAAGGRALNTAVQIAILILIAAAGTALVLTRDLLRQAVLAGFYGLLLGTLFFVFQAPDVALSQIAVGSVGVPLMLLLTIAKVRRQENGEK
jgi:energy-converting hydrogenase B subunit D